MIRLSNIQLIEALRGSIPADSWKNNDWSLMIRQARRANLLSRLVVNDRGDVPEKVLQHLSNAQLVAQANARSVRSEVEEIQHLLSAQNIPFILLKGAAYLYSGFEFGKSRVYSDVDIMVHHQDLKKSEGIFITHGWMTTKLNAYDQKYYRQWMHELPPLRHLKRQTSLDVHHTIVPPTSAYQLDAEKLWERCIPVENLDNVYTLSPVDMMLHSAVHLFSDGDFENGIRDLSDLACMTKVFSREEKFWELLLERSIDLGLTEPLFYSLRYVERFLNVEIPLEVSQRIKGFGVAGPLKSKIMDIVFTRGLLPGHVSCRDFLSGIAANILFIRSHYLRMPLRLLIPHLLRKSFQDKEEIN